MFLSKEHVVVLGNVPINRRRILENIVLKGILYRLTCHVTAMMHQQVGEEGLDTQLWTHSVVFPKTSTKSVPLCAAPEASPRFKSASWSSSWTASRRRCRTGFWRTTQRRRHTVEHVPAWLKISAAIAKRSFGWVRMEGLPASAFTMFLQKSLPVRVHRHWPRHGVSSEKIVSLIHHQGLLHPNGWGWTGSCILICLYPHHWHRSVCMVVDTQEL